MSYNLQVNSGWVKRYKVQTPFMDGVTDVELHVFNKMTYDDTQQSEYMLLYVSVSLHSSFAAKEV